MRRRPVRVFGGPLDGGVYELEVHPGALLELSSPAGVCTYRFERSDAGEQILNFVGVGPLDGGSREEDQRV